MTDEAINPNTLLDQYRINADPFMREQAELFRAMTTPEQRELLFWMVMHASAAIGAAMSKQPGATN